MEKTLYNSIFKRKSFHVFRDKGYGKLTEKDIDDIKAAFDNFDRLCPDIRVEMKIVPSDKISFRKDAEYCILLYSEKKENWLMNIGYIGEQLDLWLTDHNIGSLWFGMGKPDEADYNGLSYAIMFAIKKVEDVSLFRKDMYKSKRKAVDEYWSGEDYGIADIVRFAPSAVNSQPWLVESDGGKVTVYRYTKNRMVGLMSPKAAAHLNRIDIGIFLCCLELCFMDKGMDYSRTLFVDDRDDGEKYKVAEYLI